MGRSVANRAADLSSVVQGKSWVAERPEDDGESGEDIVSPWEGRTQVGHLRVERDGETQMGAPGEVGGSC